MAQGDTSISIPGAAPPVGSGRALPLIGVTSLVGALVLAGVQLFAFEAAVAAVAMLLSEDGVVEAWNRAALRAALLSGAVVAALAGALLLALSSGARRSAAGAIVAWDPLRYLGLAVPRARLVLACSLTSGTLIVAMHLVGSRLGPPLGPLFRKEGFFELVTVALALAAAAWSASAALSWRKYGQGLPQGTALLYATLAAALFFVGMEELNWGQTLLGFETPSAWAAINHQEQTSIHNLLAAPTLELAERVLVVAFGLGALALVGLGLRFPRSAIAAIAPPASLLPFAVLCALFGPFLRLEVTELLLMLFFAFYGYRIYVASRSTRTAKAR